MSVETDITPLVDPPTPDPPVGSEFTDVEHYDPAVKARAYELFLTTDLALHDIAIDLGINAKVVGAWSRRGKWADRRTEIEKELLASAEARYRQLIIAHRVPVMLRHLELSEAIETKLGESVRKLDMESEEPLSKGVMQRSSMLKRAAETLSLATPVSGRAVGITDKPFSGDDGPGGKRPLILLNVHPSNGALEPRVEAKTINLAEG